MIGKNGYMIQHIQEQTGTHIEADKTHEDYRWVRVKGPDADSVELAKETILDLVSTCYCEDVAIKEGGKALGGNNNEDNKDKIDVEAKRAERMAAVANAGPLAGTKSDPNDSSPSDEFDFMMMAAQMLMKRQMRNMVAPPVVPPDQLLGAKPNMEDESTEVNSDVDSDEDDNEGSTVASSSSGVTKHKKLSKEERKAAREVAKEERKAAKEAAKKKEFQDKKAEVIEKKIDFDEL